jgi:hypothetical protein
LKGLVILMTGIITEGFFDTRAFVFLVADMLVEPHDALFPILQTLSRDPA